MIDKGQWWEFGQGYTGVTPLLFTRSAMGFLMTTESQDLDLTSHPKDGAFWQYFRVYSIFSNKINNCIINSVLYEKKVNMKK